MNLALLGTAAVQAQETASRRFIEAVFKKQFPLII